MCAARRVLVVEDEPEIRSLLATVLGMGGYDVRAAEHGRAALALLADFPPCLILLDLLLPVLDGVGFIDAYCRQGEPDARLVTMSASDQEAGRAAALGVHGHLRKPFDLEALVATVDRHCRAHRSG